MTGEMELYTQLVQLASVLTNEEEEIRKICEIIWAPKVCELETDRIIEYIGDVLVKQAMTERLEASIKLGM